KIRAELFGAERERAIREMQEEAAAIHKARMAKIGRGEILSQVWNNVAVNAVTAGFIAPIVAYILTYRDTKTELFALLLSFGLCAMFAMTALAVAHNMRNAADEAKGE